MATFTVKNFWWNGFIDYLQQKHPSVFAGAGTVAETMSDHYGNVVVLPYAVIPNLFAHADYNAYGQCPKNIHIYPDELTFTFEAPSTWFTWGFHFLILDYLSDDFDLTDEEIGLPELEIEFKSSMGNGKVLSGYKVSKLNLKEKHIRMTEFNPSDEYLDEMDLYVGFTYDRGLYDSDVEAAWGWHPMRQLMKKSADGIAWMVPRTRGWHLRTCAERFLQSCENCIGACPDCEDLTDLSMSEAE